MRDLLFSAARLQQLLRAALRHGGVRFLERSAPGRWLMRRLGWKNVPEAERLRALFEDLGGTFLKFGQMLALQPDLLSLETCDALLKLLDRVDPFPLEETERTLREELGAGSSELFENFEPEPIATASVGQVYVAYLDGAKVAVKIQRPNVGFEFANDVRLFQAAMTIIRVLRIKPLYWLFEPGAEFIAWTHEELDYRNEAGYSEEVRRHAENNPLQYVPKVYARYTTRRTLVVEFLEGISVLEFLRARASGDQVLVNRLKRKGFVPAEFSANLTGNFIGDAFRNGIYHADLHPANLMILDDNVVGYIDFGITGLMSRYSRRHLLAMTFALSRGDLATLKKEYLKITSSDPRSDPKALSEGLDQLALGWYDHQGSDRRLQVNITQIFNEMLQLSRSTGVLPDRDIVKYIRSSIAIDGLLTRLDPEFDIAHHIGQSCARYISWEARHAWFSADRLQEFAGAVGRLATDGPTRATHWLARQTREKTDGGATGNGSHGSSSTGSPPEPSHRRVLHLGIAALTVSWFFANGASSASFGLNLPTAELAFLSMAGVLLLGEAWSGSRRRIR